MFLFRKKILNVDKAPLAVFVRIIFPANNFF